MNKPNNPKSYPALALPHPFQTKHAGKATQNQTNGGWRYAIETKHAGKATQNQINGGWRYVIETKHAGRATRSQTNGGWRYVITGLDLPGLSRAEIRAVAKQGGARRGLGGVPPPRPFRSAPPGLCCAGRACPATQF